MNEYEIGDLLQFHAARILKGNPVTGYVRSEDETWLTIELTKYVEGLANSWGVGEQRTFRKSYLSNIRKIK